MLSDPFAVLCTLAGVGRSSAANCSFALPLPRLADFSSHARASALSAATPCPFR
jgi:predicted protein tyrosine phosphatase